MYIRESIIGLLLVLNRLEKRSSTRWFTYT